MLRSPSLDSGVILLNHNQIVSVGEGPFEPMKRTDRPAMKKQYARQTEESLRRSILELDQAAMANVLDLQEAILGLDRILKASKTSFVLLAFGLPLLLFFRVLARVTHVQSAEG